METGRLLDAARERTGLRKLGDEWFLEPMQWLVDSINDESRLTAAGVNAGLIAAPILPGITDTVTHFKDLVSAAKAAGARFAHPSPLRLYPVMRDQFVALLNQEFPELVPRYRAAYRRAGTARSQGLP